MAFHRRNISHSTDAARESFSIAGMESLESRQMLSAAPTPLVGITNPANNHTYYLLPKQSWAQAEAKAVQLGGHLATVRNLAEHQWLWQTFSPASETLWIGINDVAENGTFVWSSGEAVNYTNWGSMEPNNDWTGEMWGSLWGFYEGGNWNDLGPSSPEGPTQFGIAEVFTPPDLVVQVGRLPQVVTPGTAVSVRTYLANSGLGDAPANQVRYYLSSDKTLGKGDVLLGKAAAPAIKARQIGSLRGSAVISAGTKCGDWYLLACVDATNILVETSESNNVSIAAPIKIACGAAAPLAAQCYEEALAAARNAPNADLGGVSQFIARHEGVIPYVYPDENGLPTVGAGFGLQPGAAASVDSALGAGTYNKMTASWEKTKEAWINIYGRRSWSLFKYNAARNSIWRQFERLAPAHGGLAKVVTLDSEVPGGKGSATILLEQTLPAYVRLARNILGKNAAGGWVYYALPAKAQAAVLDIVYDRGADLQTMTGMINALRAGDFPRAAYELMNAPSVNSGLLSSQPWADTARARAIEDFRYLAAGRESELVSYAT